MSISATFLDVGNNIEYEQVYQTRRGFLSAVSRGSRKSIFLYAIDYTLMRKITPDNLSDYRNHKIENRDKRLNLFKK